MVGRHLLTRGHVPAAPCTAAPPSTPAAPSALQGGSEIIEALVSNSATFQGKTEFSQDKYKRRKAKKYITMLTLVRPTARAIAEVR